MPIYEYKCEKCGFVKEIIHKISENPEVSCPECCGTMSKLISPAAFHLKGSGWYVTDYKNNNKSSSQKENKKKKSENNCQSCKAKAVNE